MSDIVGYEKRGRIGIITLNRPEARNAVNGDVASGVEAAIDQIEADDDVWVAVLTANTAGQEKPVFCAGADLKANQFRQCRGAEHQARWIRRSHLPRSPQADHRCRRRSCNRRRV